MYCKLMYQGFEHIMSVDIIAHKISIEMEFLVDNFPMYQNCYLGKMANKDAEKVEYWFGLTPDGTQAYSYDTFEELVNARVFCDKSLKEVWNSVYFFSLNSATLEEVLPFYLNLSQDYPNASDLYVNQVISYDSNSEKWRYFKLAFSEFERIATKEKTCINATFRVDNFSNYKDSRFGRTIDYDAKTEAYWFELTPDGSESYKFNSFRQLANAKVFSGKTMKEIWSDISFLHINEHRPDEDC